MPVIIVIRDLALDAEGRTIPVVPATWNVTPEDNAWYTIRRPDGMFCHARLMATDGTKGAFVVAGPASILRQIYLNTTAWTIAQLRADDSQAARRIKNAWRDDRPVDEVGNPIGVREALYATMAGFVHHSDLESTEALP